MTEPKHTTAAFADRQPGLEAYWMPFTANRDFNLKPRVISGAAGHWYTREDGTRIYDTFSGLWTTGLGHCHPKIVEAVQKQVATLDYCITFQVTNDKALALAERAAALAPTELNVLHTLAQVSAPAPLPSGLREGLADASSELMRYLTVIGEAAARVPICDEHPGVNAGLALLMFDGGRPERMGSSPPG